MGMSLRENFNKKMFTSMKYKFSFQKIECIGIWNVFSLHKEHVLKYIPFKIKSPEKIFSGNNPFQWYFITEDHPQVRFQLSQTDKNTKKAAKTTETTYTSLQKQPKTLILA